MKPKTNIVISGIGGVGGYFGGLLAKAYSHSDAIDVYFMARGAHLKQIQQHGLKVIKGDNPFIAFPTMATDKAEAIGIADIILICTKSYDLETAIQQLRPCIGPNTLILPLLNGVDAASEIRRILPGTTVLEGCVYIVSRQIAPGVVENKGNIQQLFFGYSDPTLEALPFLKSLFESAGIETILSADIASVIWEKFIFISPTATATTYFNLSIGALLENETCYQKLCALINEVTAVATAKGIATDSTVIENTLAKLKALPFETTSSMHSDYKNNKQSELESLTGSVVRMGHDLNIAVPVYEALYQAIKI